MLAPSHRPLLLVLAVRFMDPFLSYNVFFSLVCYYFLSRLNKHTACSLFKILQLLSWSLSLLSLKPFYRSYDSFVLYYTDRYNGNIHSQIHVYMRYVHCIAWNLGLFPENGCWFFFFPFPRVVKKVAQYMADVLEDSKDKVQENLLANGGKLIFQDLILTYMRWMNDLATKTGNSCWGFLWLCIFYFFHLNVEGFVFWRLLKFRLLETIITWF